MGKEDVCGWHILCNRLEIDFLRQCAIGTLALEDFQGLVFQQKRAGPECPPICVDNSAYSLGSDETRAQTS